MMKLKDVCELARIAERILEIARILETTEDATDTDKEIVIRLLDIKKQISVLVDRPGARWEL